MIKSFAGFCLFLAIGIASCKNSTDTEPKNYIDVSGYLKGQLAFLDTVPYSFLKQTVKDTVYSDSSYITIKEVKEIVSLFLVKELEKKELEKEFTETTFLDATLNTLTLTYEPIQKFETIQRVDVYVNPESEGITKIYIIRKKEAVTQQLLWKHNSSFTLITTTIDDQNKEDVRTVKVIWNEPNE